MPNTIYNQSNQEFNDNFVKVFLTEDLSCSNAKETDNKDLPTPKKGHKKRLIIQARKHKSMSYSISANKLDVKQFFEHRRDLTWIVEDKCSSAARRVFSYLKETIDCKSQIWACAIETIAKQTRRSIQHTKRGLTELYDMGIINRKSLGYQQINTYSFNFKRFEIPLRSRPTTSIGSNVETLNNKELISIRNKSYKTKDKTHSEKEFSIEGWSATGKTLEKAINQLGMLKYLTYKEEFIAYCLKNPRRAKDGLPWNQFNMNGFFISMWIKKSESLRYQHSRLIPYQDRLKYNQTLRIKEMTEESEKPFEYRDTRSKILFKGAYITLEEYNLLNRPKTARSEEELEIEIDNLLAQKSYLFRRSL